MDVKLEIPIYKIIGEVADRMNVEAYTVGGVVRDYFLQRHCTDIDVVCIGNGIALANEVAKEIGKLHHKEIQVNVFKNFGTASFIYYYNDEKWQIEFVGARKESYRLDSRKPIVEDGTLEDDQNRRDFTINAMAVGLNSHNFGSLLDPFHGIRDLGNGLIKTPLDPDITFSDDPLRMMRAVRFAAQLNFVIHIDTFDAIKRNVERLSIVSAERICVELNKIVSSNHPSYGFELMQKTGILAFIFPELDRLRGTETVDGRSHKDNFKHTLEVLDHVAASGGDLWLRWAAIMHDIGKPDTKRYDAKLGWTFHGHEVRGCKMVKKIFNRLRLPLDTKMRYVEKLVLLHLRPIILAEDIVTDSAVRRLLFDAGEDIDDLMALCEADITSKNMEKVKRFKNNFLIVRQKLVEIEEKDRIRNFQPPVSREDIMKTFGVGPCREIGIIKDTIKDAILDGKIPNERESAIQMMHEIANEIGLKSVSDNQ